MADASAVADPQEEQKSRIQDDLDCFRKLEERLNMVKSFTKANKDKRDKMGDDFKNVRTSIANLNKHQEQALQKTASARK